MSNPIRMPITNIFDGSDYSAQILIGSGQVPANVILDTGSSTLAVNPSAYDGSNDKNLQPTKYAQLVEYGTGGWVGPLVTTSLTMGVRGNTVSLQRAPIAIADVQQQGNFQGVDGILGLAYANMNGAYDFSPLLAANNIKSGMTYPWPFPSHNFGAWAQKFGEVLQKMQQVEVPPYFDELEDNGTVANKFAFYTLRSWVSFKNGTTKSAMAKNPLNNGVFVLGGGEEQTDLYSGPFLNVDVLDDQYYNTNLKAVQVAGCPAVPALALQAKYKKDSVSNSIIDSGTSNLTLAGDVYQAILSSLKKLNPKFIDLISQGNGNAGVAVTKLKLSSWPNITFILNGENGEDINLVCTPQTYWQVDFPAAGQARFQISGPLDDANQSILGLPLMNNYYVVFDRSIDKEGVVKFAPIKQP